VLGLGAADARPAYGATVAVSMLAFTSQQPGLEVLISSVFGGGISNGGFGVPPATLTLTDSIVNANRLDGSPGLPLNGGGIYTESSIAPRRTVVAGNKPNDCFGCA
jgi:hypothetical protein